MIPKFLTETAAKKLLVCGLDEAGRGPLAGPVYAAAVILGDRFNREILDDSKKLKPGQREEARRLICEGALAWGVGWASHAEIDSINILQASLLAMKRAFAEMLENTEKSGMLAELASISGSSGQFPTLDVIVDGLHTPDISAPCRALVKADAQIPEVMAASILAKTSRDAIMDHYAALYPEYGYEKHKGYPTKEHRAAIIRYGPSPIQRMSFTVKPV
jgi:ribonuclease HII